MTKQKEIREWLEHNFHETNARVILDYLHSQGCVLKVERELPENPIKVTNAFGMSDEEARDRNWENDCLVKLTQSNMLDAGYVATEPLIEEKP